MESDILVTPKGQMPQPHRFQAPIPLLEVFIRSFSDPGDLIVDPYAGGATTLVVAHAMGRRAIGHVIDAGIVDQAKRNLAKRLKGDHARDQPGYRAPNLSGSGRHTAWRGARAGPVGCRSEGCKNKKCQWYSQSGQTRALARRKPPITV
ncbi:MAG: site-specific DNA-methyltransferase [Haliea sp.]|nr:site-specific DNA-methyltransferase [Haliea sp.]